MDRLYAGIDLHSNNSYVGIIDEQEKVVLAKRYANDLTEILAVLAPYQSQLQGIVIESTYNWYWLVDGLQAAGYHVELANPCAIQVYRGIKHTDDKSDALWLAKLLKLSILPTGYIYPKAERAVRDMFRKRMKLVRNKTQLLLQLQIMIAQHTGKQLRGSVVYNHTEAGLSDYFSHDYTLSTAGSLFRLMKQFDKEIKFIEHQLSCYIKPSPTFKALRTVYGIGPTLAQAILFEVGDISRFAKVGNYASYCRCVNSQRISNAKSKGSNNRKNGNPYLAWAYVEAAHFAIRAYDSVKTYYQKKQSKTHSFVALKAVAHKLCRASFHVMRDGTQFDEKQLFKVSG